MKLLFSQNVTWLFLRSEISSLKRRQSASNNEDEYQVRHPYKTFMPTPIVSILPLYMAYYDSASRSGVVHAKASATVVHYIPQIVLV